MLQDASVSVAVVLMFQHINYIKSLLPLIQRNLFNTSNKKMLLSGAEAAGFVGVIIKQRTTRLSR